MPARRDALFRPAAVAARAEGDRARSPGTRHSRPDVVAGWALLGCLALGVPATAAVSVERSARLPAVAVSGGREVRFTAPAETARLLAPGSGIRLDVTGSGDVKARVVAVVPAAGGAVVRAVPERRVTEDVVTAVVALRPCSLFRVLLPDGLAGECD